MKSKKGGIQATIVGVTILLVVAMVGSMWYFSQPQAATVVNVPGGQAITSGGAPVGILSDDATNIKVRYEDKSASTQTYAANVVSYMQYINGLSGAQALVTMANTSTSDYSAATAIDVPISTVPVIYRPIAVEHKKGDATVYGYSSALAKDIAMNGANLFVDFYGQRTDILKATVVDKTVNPAVALAASKTRATGTNTSAQALNNTWVDQPANSALTIDADEYFDVEISVQTNNTRNKFGNNALVFNGKALRTIVAIDADSTDWVEPIVSGGNIQKIDKSTLSGDDGTVLSNSEWFYTIDPIGDSPVAFRWRQDTKSAVNADMDPIWRFCTEGLYKSSDDADTIKVGCFDDSSSNLELTHNGDSTLANAIIIDIT